MPRIGEGKILSIVASDETFTAAYSFESLPRTTEGRGSPTGHLGEISWFSLRRVDPYDYRLVMFDHDAPRASGVNEITLANRFNDFRVFGWGVPESIGVYSDFFEPDRLKFEHGNFPSGWRGVFHRRITVPIFMGQLTVLLTSQQRAPISMG